MFRPFRVLLAVIPVFLASCVSHASAVETPGCTGLAPKDCLTLVLQAMGGQEKIEGIHNVQLDIASHTALTEQSYRQDPFISSYERSKTTIDLIGQRVRIDDHLIWPESDPHQAEMDVTLIATPSGGVYHSAQGDSPSSLADIDDAAETLALGPSRLLLTALHMSDLHFEAPATLRSTSHTVVAFYLE